MASPEHALQVALIRLLDRSCKCIWWAVPNGGLRDIRTAVRLKAEGVTRGVPDLCFVLDSGRFCGLELKAKKGRLSVEQLAFGTKLLSTGAGWNVAYSLDEAIDILNNWGAINVRR